MKLAEEFFALFAGLERAHGAYDIPVGDAVQGDKVKGKAVTTLEPVTLTLWEEHLAGRKGLGVVPIRDDATVRFAAADIDDRNVDLRALEVRAHQLALPFIICRSKSGGAHAYVFFSEPVSAALAQGKVKSWASALGYPGIEIFPKQTALASHNDVGNWINMPYFGCTGGESTRYALHQGKAIGAEAFIKLARERAMTGAALEAHALPPGEVALEDGPPCLQHLAKNGFQEGERNNSLFNLGVYARLRFGDEHWRDQLREMNNTMMVPPLDTKEVATLVRSVGRKDYFYTCTRSPIVQHCNKEICRRQRYGIGALVEIPDITLNKLVKICTEPPTWIAVVGETRMELKTEDLMSQTRFKLICIEKLNIIPKPLRQSTWDKMVRDLLKDVEIVQAPREASPEGQFLHHVESFCTGRAQARARDELLQGKPWTDDERTYFRSSDLLRYLDQQHFRTFTQREAWTVLQRNGAVAHSFNLKGKKVFCWSVPAFDEQTEDFAVPRAAQDF